MNKLYKAAIIGIGLTISIGILYLILTFNKINSKGLLYYTDIILETYKTLLTFSLITLGGIFLKVLIDQVVEKDRNHQIEQKRHEDTRKTILKEFAAIFSEFYSIRKLYHSAFEHENIYDKQSESYKILIRQVLQKSVDLEGRYGSLKILAITHFDLPRGEYQKKPVDELKKIMSLETDRKKLARCRIDLLGESYDDWRHAFENNTKITVDNEFWKCYELLLHFFEKGD